MAAELGAVVDAVVSADLSALSVAELQEQYATVAPQVQRLTGFGGAVLAVLQSRTGGLLPTEQAKPRPPPGWAAEASGDSASAAAERSASARSCRRACLGSPGRCWTGSCPPSARRC